MKFLNRLHILWLLLILMGFASLSACKKDSTAIVDIPADAQKKTLIDYLLNYEGMYMVKYKVFYNEQYQVREIYRGEQFAADLQMQLFARMYYSEQKTTPAQQLPDSVVFYNTKGKVSEVVRTDFRPLPSRESGKNYLWPDRHNKVMDVPGIAALMAIAGKKVNWGGDGHLGSGATIDTYGSFSMVNSPSLSDVYTEYYEETGYDFETKTWKKMTRSRVYMLRFQEEGFPTDVIFTNNLNPAVPYLKIAYKRQ